MDDGLRQEFRRKNLCYSCREPWVPGHKCHGKGNLHQMECYSKDGSDSEISELQTEVEENEYEEAPEGPEFGSEDRGVVAQLSSIHKNESFRVRGVIGEHRVIALNDIGATHNFIDERIVAKKGLVAEEVEGFKVMVADGSTISCNRMISNMSLKLGNHEIRDDFFVVSIGGIDDAVLGIQWLRSLGEITLNLQTMELKFMSEWKKVVLRGMSHGGLKVVSLKRMERLIRHNEVEWAVECLIMPSNPLVDKGSYASDISTMIKDRSKIMVMPSEPQKEHRNYPHSSFDNQEKQGVRKPTSWQTS